jgi:hypothetical protein
MTSTQTSLTYLAQRWRTQTYLREAIFAMAGAAVLAALKVWWPNLTWWLPAGGFLLILAARLTRSRPWLITAALVARHLDRSHPVLEESCGLWLREPPSLSLVERRQLGRLNAAVIAMSATTDASAVGAPPRRFLWTPSWCLLAGILVLAAIAAAAAYRTHVRAAPDEMVGPAARHTDKKASVTADSWPKIVGCDLRIVPPAYTGHPARQIAGGSAEVEEGAAVTWRLTLDRPVHEARLVFGENGTGALPLQLQPGRGEILTGSRAVTETGLYHVAATLPDGRAWSPPELFSLQVIRDRPPGIRILQPAQPGTTLATTAAPLAVESLAWDDYGLVDTHLVVTVAKGEGEAVKFREQTIAFDSDTPAAAGPGIPAGARRLVKTLDLGALGLEPGDELYFHIEATDNRQPTANRTRSETRFVTIQGPAQTPPSSGLGVAGVNLVPQYFRSERQLIIDTEKLVADRPTLPAAEFQRRSNDLGIDQDLLRLRYGQFAGEEFDQSNVSDHVEVNLNPLQAAPVHSTGPRAAASIAQRFQQEHTEQDREGVSPQEETGPRAAPERPLSADQVRAPFVDEHDSQEKATYLDHQTKGTLHEALSAMWAAEGFLRTNRPPDALAPEQRALDILKDLQQGDRAYVQHVGFDAPPLKIAERRMQGDVASVPRQASVPSEMQPAGDAQSVSAVRATLAAVPWNEPAGSPTAEEIAALRRVEPALTVAATSRPQAFLAGLQALRRVEAGAGARTGKDLELIERALLGLLPPAEPLPERRLEAAPALAGSYYDACANSTGNPGAP